MRAPLRHLLHGAALTAGMLLPLDVPAQSVLPAGAAASPAAVQPTRAAVRTAAGTREYLLHVSPAPAGGARPALLVLHGCTQTADDIRRGARLDAWADRVGAVVIYAEQPATANPQRCWNWYDPAHQQRGDGEPAMLVAMLDSVTRAHAVDPGRVYVAGISAGGAMAAILATAYPERFAAVAVHSGIPVGVARSVPEALVAMRGGGAVPPLAGTAHHAVPLLAIQGGADRVVAPVNGDRTVAQWLGSDALLATVHTTLFPAASAYTVRRAEYRTGDRVRAVLVTIDGLAHAWAGGAGDGTYTDPAAPDATAMITDFFDAHRRIAP